MLIPCRKSNWLHKGSSPFPSTQPNKKNMAEFSTEVDIDPSEFVSECGRGEKIELIDLIVEECADDSMLKKELIKSIREYFPQSSQEIIDPVISSKNTFMHDEFLDSLNKLREAYYRLSNEDIEKINELAKRF